MCRFVPMQHLGHNLENTRGNAGGSTSSIVLKTLLTQASQVKEITH